ncbi:hypothetical protein [Citricoccus sp. NR2]
MTSGKHRINQGGHRQLNAAILPHRNRQDEIPRTHNRLRRTPNC